MFTSRTVEPKRLALVAAIVIPVILLFVWLSSRGNPSEAPEPAVAAAETVNALSGNASGGEERAAIDDRALADTLAQSEEAHIAPEVLATRRMIAAHAPLRVPAVADPDSPENQAVLQQMLTQILAPAAHLTEGNTETLKR